MREEWLATIERAPKAAMGALLEMPAKHREVVSYVLVGYTQVEVSKLLGLSQAQVSRVMAAYKRRFTNKL